MALVKKIGLIISIISFPESFCFGKDQSYGACLKEMNLGLVPKICEMRNYAIITGNAMNAHMKCTLKSFGWSDNSAEIKVQSVLNDARAVVGDLEKNIARCARKAENASVNSKANQFYICMLQSNSKEIFKTIFDLRELKALHRWKKQSFTFKAVADTMRRVDAEHRCH
ncbi:37 kDa salivary gland allergen Aed a 2-like [Sabethes cyaneus]|uniref:37 kDa salivary gland allergen Aed a 2-like n=1 Tax=Sabethes cyaneus TaxID=53552 RepID=UPI00237E8939|nr:37 kDa salivary gland allergen Aed a 2-like [Sabethes cyaneus]